MPKGASQYRVDQLRKMSGKDFVMLRVSHDFLCLSKDERARAVRVLSALHESFTKVEEATAQ